MRILLIFSFLSILFLGSTQTEFDLNSYYFGEIELSVKDSAERSRIAGLGLKGIKSYVLNDDGSKTDINECHYDQNGKITYWRYKHWKSDKKYKVNRYDYNSNGTLLDIQQSDYKENPHLVMKFSFNEAGVQTYYEKFDVKKGFVYSVDSRFENGRYVEISHHYNSPENLKYHWIYDYYEDSSKKETRYYKNNKLKYTWHYECDPAGKIEELKHKDTTSVCVREELDQNGNRVAYYQMTDPRGELKNRRLVFDKEEPHKVIATSLSKIDGTLISEWSKNENEEVFINYVKGEKRSISRITFNQDGQKTSFNFTYSRYKESSTSTIYEYDNGKLVKEIHKNNKGEVEKAILYEYSYYKN